MPFDEKMKYCKLLSLGPSGFCAATEDGFLSFWKFIPEKKNFEFVSKWTCQAIQNQKIVSLAFHELNKEEHYLAIATKSQNIIYLNVLKEVYGKANQQGGNLTEKEQ